MKPIYYISSGHKDGLGGNIRHLIKAQIYANNKKYIFINYFNNKIKHSKPFYKNFSLFDNCIKIRDIPEKSTVFIYGDYHKDLCIKEIKKEYEYKNFNFKIEDNKLYDHIISLNFDQNLRKIHQKIYHNKIKNEFNLCNPEKFNIVLHIRRGDVLRKIKDNTRPDYKKRFTTDKKYILAIKDIILEIGKNYKIIIFSEGFEKDFIIYKKIFPEAELIIDNERWRYLIDREEINHPDYKKAVDNLKKLLVTCTSADVLLGAKSHLSIILAYLNNNISFFENFFTESQLDKLENIFKFNQIKSKSNYIKNMYKNKLNNDNNNFFKDMKIKIPNKFSHNIENINEDNFFKLYPDVILSCYFNLKKDPVHHSEVKNQQQPKDNYNYIKPLYESCLKNDLHLIIFYDNLSEGFVKKYQTDKIIFRKVKLVSDLSINDERYIIYYEYLLKNKYKNVFSSDISDVFINKNPFELIKDYYKRSNIDQNDVDKVLNNEKKFEKSKYYPFPEKAFTEYEKVLLLKSLREISTFDYSNNLIFIGLNSVYSGPEIKTKNWFEHRLEKINRFNLVLEKNCKKYGKFDVSEKQVYNPGTIMSNYNSYMCLIKKFLKFLFYASEERENYNWNMIIFNFIFQKFLGTNYNNENLHTRYLYTGYPFISIYQKMEKKSLCYVVHK